MARLKVKVGRDEGKLIELEKESLSLGRDSGDIIVHDKAASRQHAEIFRIGEMVFIRDLKSRNGTFVNEKTVDEQILQMGDKIRIGATIYVFEDDSDPFRHVAHEDLFHESEASNSTVEFTIDPLLATLSPAGSQGSQRILSFFQSLTHVLAASRLSSERLFADVAALVKETLGADLVAFLIPEGKALKARHVLGQENSVKISQSVARRVVEQGRPLMSRNAMSDARFKANQSIVGKRIESFIAAPLAVGDKILGCVYLGRNVSSNSFNEDDFELANIVGLQVGLALETLEAHRVHRDMFLNTIKLLTAASEGMAARRGRAQRVMAYAVAMAEELKLTPDDTRTVQLSALLHEIGRIGLDPKASSDVNVVRDRSVRMLAGIPGFEKISEAVTQIHERLDGSGPLGLKGSAIGVVSAVVGVASEFEHMTTEEGVSGEGLPIDRVLKSFYLKANKKFEGRIVKALLIAHRNGRLYAPDLLFFGSL